MWHDVSTKLCPLPLGAELKSDASRHSDEHLLMRDNFERVRLGPSVGYNPYLWPLLCLPVWPLYHQSWCLLSAWANSSGDLQGLEFLHYIEDGLFDFCYGLLLIECYIPWNVKAAIL